MTIDDDEKHLTRNTHSHAHTHQRSNNNYIESTVARKMKPLFNINKKAGLQLWIINVLNWKSFKCYCLNGCCGDLVTLLWLLLSILHSYWQKCAVSKLSKDLKKKKKLTEIAWKNGKKFPRNWRDRRLSGNYILQNKTGERWNTCKEKRIPKKTVNEHKPKSSEITLLCFYFIW